ncbi:hypothetical protein FB451DRAFT_1362307 [Mycena latifolia]|nr:hypothetical protein FB451DRAFT_1362307 [Mycena latifolia]
MHPSPTNRPCLECGRATTLSLSVYGPVSPMRDIIPQLQSSILLAALSLIPNDTLRYTLLEIAACLALLYVVHLKRPSTQLRQLEDIVQTTEGVLGDAKLYCPRDLLGLVEKGLRIKRSASMIQCRLLEANTVTWKKYRLLSRDISDCTKKVKEIRTAVQLIVETERQRKYTDDISETVIILTNVRSHELGNQEIGGRCDVGDGCPSSIMLEENLKGRGTLLVNLMMKAGANAFGAE